MAVLATDVQSRERFCSGKRSVTEEWQETTVSVQRTESYAENAVQQAVNAHFAALELNRSLKPGMKVLIKPNLLSAKKPQQAATTHPMLVRCIIRALRSLGITDITVADSPGGPFVAANLKAVYAACGYRSLEPEAVLNMNTEWREVETASGFVTRRFHLIEPVCRADFIINAAKLKTHSLTGLSGGIKNLFGCIPGLQKPEFHYRFPEIEGFSGMLLELAQTVRPDVTFVDAVTAMEGDGPNMGTPREFGYTFASRNVFLQDFVLARTIGMDPGRVTMLRLAEERGLCKPASIRLVGDEPKPERFLLPQSITNDYLSGIPRFMRGPVGVAAKTLLRPVPHILTERCIGCGRCAESCPQGIIQLRESRARIQNRSACISCFCCQEMCPAHAIAVRRRLKGGKQHHEA